MATITDVPNGAGASTAWAGTYTDVQVDDADTTNINTDTATAEEMWTFPTLPVGLLSPAISATFTAKARLTGGAPTMAIYDGTVWGAYQALTGSYVTYSQASASLVIATMEAYQSGVKRDGLGAGNNINCTYATRIVVANYAAGFVFDFCSWLVPLLGAAVDLATWHRAVARVRQGQRLVSLTAEEREAFFREWQAYRHPVYV